MRKKYIVNNKQGMKEAIEKYNTITKWFDEYCKKDNFKIFNEVNDLGLDSRDFEFVTAFVKNCDSKEEFFKSLDDEYKELKSDFKGTITKFLDKYEKCDFINLKSDTKEQCFDTIMLAKLAQIPGNINTKNPEFKAQRYNTLEKQRELDNFVSYMSMTMYDVNDSIWEQTGYNLNSQMETEFEGYSELLEDDQMKEIISDPSCTEKYDKGESKYYEVNVPSYFYYYSDLNSEKKDELSADIQQKFNGSIGNNDIIMDPLVSRFVNADSYAARNVKGVEDYEYKSIFIDGKPLYDLIDRKNDNKREEKTKANCILAEAIRDGKAIDVVQSYVEKGKLKSDIVPLKFNWSPEIVKMHQEAKVKREHSWFRRTFFDWGPFKIKRDENIMEELYGKKDALNEANMEKRQSQILNYRNGKFLDELNASRKESKLEALKPGEKIESKFEEVRKDNELNKLVSGTRRAIEVNELEEDLNTGFVDLETGDKEKVSELDDSMEI